MRMHTNPIKKYPWRTTGIGSLPFLDEKEALEYSFAHSIPFLPQLPRLHPSEEMIHQSLQGFPAYDLLILTESPPSRLSTLNAHTAGFIPSSFSSLSVCWEGYLKRLLRVRPPQAKLQLAGPVTCLEVLKHRYRQELTPEWIHSCAEWLKQRALHGCEQVKKTGSKPLFVWDEPCLFLKPTHRESLPQVLVLKELMDELQSQDIDVGIHCCGEIHWPTLLSLGARWISFDLELNSLSFFQEMSQLQNRDQLEGWIKSQGVLCLGILSAQSFSDSLRPSPESPSAENLTRRLRLFTDQLRTTFESRYGSWVEQTLDSLVLSTSCGLALNTPEQAHEILRTLRTDPLP